MSLASSPRAGCRPTAAPGFPLATASSSRSRPWPSSLAASSGRCSAAGGQTSSFPGTHGANPGSSRSPQGEGEQTVVDSLARSVFHLAITNARLVTLDDQAVTIRYKQRKSSVWLTCRICRRRVHAPLSSTWFTQRPSQGAVLRSVAPSQTRPRRPCPPPAGARSTRRTADRSRLAAKWLPQPDDDTPNPGAPQPPVCPHCHIGHLLLIRRLTPRNSMGP